MTDVRRLLLLFSLGLILLTLYQKWMIYDDPSALPSPPAGSAARTDIPEPPAVDALPAAPAAPSEAPPGPPPLVRGERIIVTTDVLRVEIDARGGDLRRAELLTYPVELKTPDKPVVILDDQGSGLFVAQSGLIGRDRRYPNHQTDFRAPAASFTLAGNAQRLEVPLSWTAPDGVTYEKVYVFNRDRFVIDLEFRIRNSSTTPWQGYLYGQYLRTEPASTVGSGFDMRPQALSYTGGAIYTPNNYYEKIDFDDIRDGRAPLETDRGWVAMLQHYFVTAWLPAEIGAYEFYSRAREGGRFNLGYKTTQPVTIAPGAEGVLATRIYIGPKEQKRIKPLAEGLVLTVDYGWLTVIATPIFWLLNWIHGVLGNWGWAIIVLTILIKAGFYPLSAAGYKSMARMKKIQPRLKTLKERYGDDKQKFQQAMMEMYKKEKINPLGGCFPILIQIPVFIALYWVLLESVELRQAPFILWLRDLSSPDPYFVLPLIMGASMFAQQRLSPGSPDPMQQKIMMALPVVFTVFFLFFPAGLVLYWTVNNLLSIAQQWRINQVIAAGEN